jgi:hypothetical protein
MSRFVRGAGLGLVAWCALLLQGTAALAVTSFGPVVIDDCRISNARSYVAAFKPVVLAFINRQTTPADEVRFTVEYDGRTEHVVDRGTFSQNVRIEHAFDGFHNARYRDASPTCSVDYVEFQDASSWAAASAPPAPQPARTSTGI